jgi:hypothetical protein
VSAELREATKAPPSRDEQGGAARVARTSRKATTSTRRRVAGLALAALAGVALQGAVAGTLLILLLRAGVVPTGLWPALVVAGAWAGAEIAARYGVSRVAGGLVAGLPTLAITTLLALRARMGELAILEQALVFVAVVALNGLFALLGIWLAGVRARWTDTRQLEKAGARSGAAGRAQVPRTRTPIMRPGE